MHAEEHVISIIAKPSRTRAGLKLEICLNAKESLFRKSIQIVD